MLLVDQLIGGRVKINKLCINSCRICHTRKVKRVNSRIFWQAMMPSNTRPNKLNENISKMLRSQRRSNRAN